jgi:hypothetical protein
LSNQAVFWAASGFGIGCQVTGAQAGPQAGFHYAHNFGNDGNFLFSGAGAVITANMVNQEMNPYVTGSTAAIQFKDQFGTGYTISFTVGGGTVPYLASANTWSAINTFTQKMLTSFVQASNSISSTKLIAESALVSPPYTTSGVIVANDIVNGIVLASPSTGITLQLPTFTNFESAFSAILGVTTVPINTYKMFSLENISTSSAVSISANTNVAIVTQNGSPVVNLESAGSFKVLKVSSTQYAVYGVDSVNGSGGGGDVYSAANNVMTGVNVFTNTTAPQSFEAIQTTYAQAVGPSTTTATLGFSTATPSPLTGSSITITATQATGVIVTLNGSLSTQNVFVPTAAAFDAALLASFPSGSSIPVGMTYWLRIINLSATATVTLGGNTNFTIAGPTTILPGGNLNVLLQKTASTPSYAAY